MVSISKIPKMYPYVSRSESSPKPISSNSKISTAKKRIPPHLLREHNDLLLFLQVAQRERLIMQQKYDQLLEKYEDLLKVNEELTSNLKDYQQKLEVSNDNFAVNRKQSQIKYKNLERELIEAKHENDNLKTVIDNNRNRNIETVDKELKLLQDSYTKLEEKNAELAEKWDKYKTKLKYSISVVNELNNLILEVTKRPKTFNTQTQTYITEFQKSTTTTSSSSSSSNSSINRNLRNINSIDNIISGSTLRCGIPNGKLQSDDLLLSDILFKPQTFEDDLVLVKKDSWAGILENV
ncbi:unnamed protein product [Psylliodes chrysocephalus]|uniref:Uncharacterized protein n=1 Tax=Psylliodes chrysocephalus TaxID=3402493 RepID=A0A9P0D4M9_9CUCU|nr:unnamed protein product [Psylliodes chrysocephala]